MNKDFPHKTNPFLRKRIMAGIVDYTLIFSYLLLMLYLFGKPDENNELSVSGLPGASVILFWFLMTVGMEHFFGATIGNKLQKLKPVSKCNPTQKISMGQSLKRHLLDMMDFQIFGLIGVLTITKTEKNQRLGDLWAETIVISTDKTDFT